MQPAAVYRSVPIGPILSAVVSPDRGDVMKIKAKAALVGLVLSVACGAAQASEWVSVAEDSNETIKLFIDTSSIRISGNIRRAWSKYVFNPQTKKGVGNNSGKWTESEVIRFAYDCSQDLARKEALNVYFEDTSFYSVPAEYLPEPWAPVAPDTLNEFAMQYVCAWSN